MTVFQPRSFIRLEAPDRYPCHRRFQYLRAHKWRIGFAIWMVTGMPACVLGGAYAGVQLARLLA